MKIRNHKSDNKRNRMKKSSLVLYYHCIIITISIFLSSNSLLFSSASSVVVDAVLLKTTTVERNNDSNNCLPGATCNNNDKKSKTNINASSNNSTETVDASSITKDNNNNHSYSNISPTLQHRGRIASETDSIRTILQDVEITKKNNIKKATVYEVNDNNEKKSSSCKDYAGWTDGTNGCKMYVKNENKGNNWCSKYGTIIDHKTQMSAKDACCICGGGLRKKKPSKEKNKNKKNDVKSVVDNILKEQKEEQNQQQQQDEKKKKKKDLPVFTTVSTTEEKKDEVVMDSSEQQQQKQPEEESQQQQQTSSSSSLQKDLPPELKKITRKRLAKGKIPSYPADVEPNFLIPQRPLQPGELAPLVWREDGSRVDDEAYLIGIPQETTDVIKEYMATSGLYKLCQYLMYENKVKPGENRLYTIEDGYNWGAMGPKAWTTGDLTWVDAGDERSYEKTLDLLRKGNFDVVLDAVGKKFNLDGLMVQGVGVIIVSEWTGNNMHYDIGDTGHKFFNIIFPITIPSNGQGALHVGDRYDHDKHEPVNFRLNTGILLGGETRHGTGKCNYRADEEFRIGIAVYLADLDEKNIEWISGDTTSLFPNVEDVPWFTTQKGRVWSKDGNSLKNDTGRKPFHVQDDANVDCQSVLEKGECITDLHGLRMKCLKSCEVYMKDKEYYDEIKLLTGER